MKIEEFEAQNEFNELYEHYPRLQEMIRRLSVLVPEGSEENLNLRRERLEDSLERKITSLVIERLTSKGICYKQSRYNHSEVETGLKGYLDILEDLKKIADTWKKFANTEFLKSSFPNLTDSTIEFVRRGFEYFALVMSPEIDCMVESFGMHKDFDLDTSVLPENYDFLMYEAIFSLKSKLEEMITQLRTESPELAGIVYRGGGAGIERIIHGLDTLIKLESEIVKNIQEYIPVRSYRDDARRFVENNVTVIQPSSKAFMQNLSPAILILLNSLSKDNFVLERDKLETFYEELKRNWDIQERQIPEFTEGIEVEFHFPDFANDSNLLNIYENLLRNLQDLGFLLVYDALGEIPLPYSRNYLAQNMALKIFEELDILVDANLHMNLGFSREPIKYFDKLLLVNMLFESTTLFGTNPNPGQPVKLNIWSEKPVLEGNYFSSTTMPFRIRQNNVVEFRSMFKEWEGNEEFGKSNELLWQICFCLNEYTKEMDSGKSLKTMNSYAKAWYSLEQKALSIFDRFLGWNLASHLNGCKAFALYSKAKDSKDCDQEKAYQMVLDAVNDDVYFTRTMGILRITNDKDDNEQLLTDFYDKPLETKENLITYGAHNELLGIISDMGEDKATGLEEQIIRLLQETIALIF